MDEENRRWKPGTFVSDGLTKEIIDEVLERMWAQSLYNTQHPDRRIEIVSYGEWKRRKEQSK